MRKHRVYTLRPLLRKKLIDLHAFAVFFFVEIRKKYGVEYTPYLLPFLTLVNIILFKIMLGLSSN